MTEEEIEKRDNYLAIHQHLGVAYREIENLILPEKYQERQKILCHAIAEVGAELLLDMTEELKPT